MTKIILINPPLSLERRYGKLAKAGSTIPPLALCHLAAIIRKNNFEVKIIDAADLNYKEIIKKVLKENPRYIGLTAVTLSIHNAAKLANILKQKNKNLKTIIGGPHITTVPIETMKRFPEFDIGVVGEGEITIIELLKALEKNKPLNKIDGLVIRKNNKIKLTKKRECIKNMDTLPLPAWDLLENFPKNYKPAAFSFKRLPATTIVTSRGCPGQCTFCDRAVFGNIWRGYSAEYVLKMIKQLHHKYNIKDFLIDDDTFSINKRRLIKICKLLIKEKMKLTWSCNSRINDMADLKLLKLMKKAGCWQISYGIESGSQKVLDFMKKYTALKQIRYVLKLTKKACIRTKGFFMIGNLKETKQDIEKTIKFSKEIDLDDLQVNIFTPLPGSEAHNIAHEYGTFDDNWKKMNLIDVVFVPNGLTKEDLERYQAKAFREFYLRPKIILSYLKIIRRPEDVIKITQGAQSLLSFTLKRA